MAGERHKVAKEALDTLARGQMSQEAYNYLIGYFLENAKKDAETARLVSAAEAALLLIPEAQNNPWTQHLNPNADLVSALSPFRMKAMWGRLGRDQGTTTTWYGKGSGRNEEKNWAGKGTTNGWKPPWQF